MCRRMRRCIAWDFGAHHDDSRVSRSTSVWAVSGCVNGFTMRNICPRCNARASQFPVNVRLAMAESGRYWHTQLEAQAGRPARAPSPASSFNGQPGCQCPRGAHLRP